MTYTYNLTWSAAPIVLSQVQTYNDPRFVTTAKRNVAAANFEMVLEISKDNTTAHGAETVGWMAIRATTATGKATMNDISYSSVLSANTIRGYDNGCYAAAHGLGVIPAAVVGMQTTRAGGNGGWARYCNQANNWTSANTYWCIDEVDNGERAHATEQVSFIAFNTSGTITDPRYWTGQFSTTQQRGRYNITIIASDTPGNINDTETTYFIIPTYPNVTLVSPPNGTAQNTTSATFVCNATDKLWLKNITFYLWNSTGGLVQSNTTAVSGKKNQSNITTTLAEGAYHWNCIAGTIYGMTASAPDNHTIIIDLTSPAVNITSPANSTTYNTTFNIPLNFTATDSIGIDSCWYVLNAGGAVPIPGCLNTTINVSAGQNNLTVYANDTAGNKGNDFVQFYALWATTMFINTTKNPVENGEKFYYYADYEYAHNGSDVLGASCTVQQLNATDVRWHNGMDNADEYFNTTQDYYATKLENLPASFIADTYKLQVYIALNSTGNKNLRIWVTDNQSSWNSTQAYSDTINTTTNPELNSTVQLINRTLNSSFFPASGNYTIILSCSDCNSTDYYVLGKDTDNFGHSYEAHGTPVTWSNMSLDAFEHMLGILLTIKPIPMIYNSTNSRYERSAYQYLYAAASLNYTYQINCSKALHVPQSNKSILTVANNYIPQPNITSIIPDPALLGVNDVTVTWTTDASGKAFGILESYVNLSYPNGTFIQKYQGHPFVINKALLTVTGNYTLTAYARNSIGSNTSNKTFEVIYPRPLVTILTPLGETYENYRAVTIAANVTFRNGEGTVLAEVTKPDSSKTNLTLTTPIKSDTFQNATQWQNHTWYISPGQQCTQAINNSMNIVINGTGVITLTKCGYYSTKSTYRDFNATIDFNITAINPGVILMFKVIENYIRNTGNGVGVSYQYLAGQRRVVAQQEKFGNITILNDTITSLNSGTLGISRTNNTFTLYFINSSGTQNVATTTAINATKGLYFQIFVQSVAPDFYARNITMTNFTIQSNDTKIYTANYRDTGINGTYNVTIYANNTYGAMNNTEKTNFTTIYINTPPTPPVILSPIQGEIIYGIYPVTWEPITDFQTDQILINITLLYPNGTFYQNIATGLNSTNIFYYHWNTSTAQNGHYKIKMTAYESATAEKLSSSSTTGTFIIDQEPPSVAAIYPIPGEIFDNTRFVTLAANITDPDGIDTAYANVTLPNSTIRQVSLTTPQQGDNFNNNTMNISWIKDASEVGPPQTCIADIDTTIPGQAFISLSGNGIPRYFTECSIAGMKRVVGDFDISVDFDLLGKLNGPSSGVNLYVSDKSPTVNSTRMVILSYANYAPDGNAYYAFSQMNGSGAYSGIFQKNDTAGKLRITRVNDTFRTYFWNNTLGNWTEIPLPINNISLVGRAMYVAMQVESSYPEFSTVNASFDNLTIISNNYFYGMLQSITPLGRHNVTFWANDTLGRINGTSTTWYNTTHINNPPTYPEILTPRPQAEIYGNYLITWVESIDEDGDTILYNITLLNPDLTENATIAANISATSYLWNTALHNDGVYSMRVRAWENATAQHYYTDAILEGDGNFTIINKAPRVIVITPINDTFDNTGYITIAINATDPQGIDTAIAQITKPNGSSVNITLGIGQQSDSFDNNTMNISWTKDATEIGPLQTCIADINTTIPGKAFLSLTGSGLPDYFTECSIASMKRIAGDFDISVDFDLLGSLNNPSSGINLYISETLPTVNSTRKVILSYANYTPDNNAYYAFSQLNGSGAYSDIYQKDDITGKLRITRVNDTFRTYFWNNTLGNWTEIPLPINNMSTIGKSVYVAMQVESSYPEFSSVNASFDNLTIWSNNYTFEVFKSITPIGRHNITFYVNNTYGRMNDTETTWYNTTPINDPPTFPEILTPRPHALVGGQYSITWVKSIDEDGDNILYNITLLNPDLSFNATIATHLPGNQTSYLWNTTQHNDGIYSMRIRAWENETAEKYYTDAIIEGDGNFTIQNTRPSVVIISPLGQAFDQDKIVVISVNATAPSGIKNVAAKIDTPNSTSKTIVLDKGLQSDDFSNSSAMNTTWLKVQDIAGAQVCTADINGTIPGRGFANLSGNGFPNTFSICGVGSRKRIDGNFDINVTWYIEQAKQDADSGVVLTLSESNTASFAKRQLAVYYGNVTGYGPVIRVYANDNGTMQVISQVPFYTNTSTLRVVRVNNTFTIYDLNESSGNWTLIPTLKPVLNLSRALHVQMGVASMYEKYSGMAASVGNLNIVSENLTFGLFNYTGQLGLYNVSITAIDNFGGINNSEKTNFTIAYKNDPPSMPYILTPSRGDVWSLFDYIAWIQVEDEENHTVQFNITLLNPNYTYNTTIISNYGDITTTVYSWNTSTVPDGIYSINVKVFENSTPEKLSQSNTLAGNFTVNNRGPKVFDLRPLNGSTFPHNSTVLIGANVTDIVGVDTVLVNVTLPDNTVQQIKLNYTSGDWYEQNFTNTIIDGTYKARFIANDTYGKINSTEITFFVIPNVPPNITVNSPLNGSNFTMNIFNITVNVTVTDPNNDSLCVKVHASNTTPIINESYHLLARVGACYNQSTETIIYNWTSPVIQPDASTVLLLHFDYEDSLGENLTHFYDFSRNNNSGSCVYNVSCPTYVSGKIGAAMEYFPGEYVTVQDSPELDGMNEITLEAWIKGYDISAFQIIGKNQSYEIYTDATGHVYFKLFSPNATAKSTSTTSLNTWHMIQATYNGSVMKIYFDGVLENTTNRTGAVANTTYPLVIGIDSGDLASNGLDGIIDQVVVHNRSLPYTTIRNHYRLAPGTWYWHVHADDYINETVSGEYHINILPSIYLLNISPGAGQEFCLNETPNLKFNASAALSIDKVRCDVMLPNGTVLQIYLNNTSGQAYEANFTNLMLRGIYNYTCYANDTINDETTTFTSHFRRISPPGKFVDMITGNMTRHVYADYSTAVMQNTSGTLDLNITINSTRVPRIILYNHSENSMHSVIRLSDFTNENNESFADSGWAIDLTHLNMTYANVTAYTDGNHLLKCTNMSWATLQCADEFEYTYVKEVQNGTTYTILLNATDPIFITTVIGNNSINDSSLRQNQPNTPQGALASMRIGRGAAAGANFRPIIRFNLTGVPQGAVINSARLGLYFFNIPAGDSTANRTYDIYKVQQNPARDWIELQATWNRYNTTNLWTTAGGDYIGTPTGNITFDSTALNSFVYWDVTSDVQNFSDNRSQNFGWIIMDSQNTARTRRDFRSKEAVTAAQRPVLILNYTEYTALLAAKTNFSGFTFSSSAYVPVFTILFNTTMNQSNITMLSSFNLEKATGTGIDTISARVYLDGVLVATDQNIETASVGEPQPAGIIPIMQNVTNGTHNITVEFARTGNGDVKVYNIDFNIIEMRSAHDGIVPGQITPANYQHTIGGTGYPYMFNWTMNRSCLGDAFVTAKGTHTSTGVNTAISYKFIDIDTLEESPTWEAVTLNSSDVHSMSGNWIFYNQLIGANNMTVGSRNYQAGRTTTVNMTIFDAQMNDCANRTIQAIRATNNLTNWSTAITINDTWTKIVTYNVTMKYGTGLFAAFTSTPQLITGDLNAQNLTQRITVQGPGANCTIEKVLGLFGSLDAGNLYLYTVCENMTVGQTYEVAGWGRAAPGRVYNQYDEALSAFEINPKPVQQIQLETRPDLEAVNLTFSDNNPREWDNITITATVRNNGASASSIQVKFTEGNCSNGTQINGLQTITILNKTQTAQVNVTWNASQIGPHNISVCVDPNNIINESNKTNNNLTRAINVKAWQLYYGNVTGNITLATSANMSLYEWQSDIGVVYAISADTVFNFSTLQALGRNKTGGLSSNDFAEADINLNMTGFNDSVQLYFAVNASLPKQTMNFTVQNRTIQFVPYINSTNTSDFVTGILWDTRNDTDGQYGTADNEPLVFVANINKNKQGKYGIYDYEIFVPRNLARYKGLSDIIYLYAEMN